MITKKKTVSHAHVSQSHEANVSDQEVPMTTKKTVSHAQVSESQTPAVSTPAEVAPLTATPVVFTAPPPAPIFFAPPPANAVIPVVPSDYVRESGATYRSSAPKKQELLLLAQAVDNLAQFTNYAKVMGPYAPPYEETLALFKVVYQWSSMRTASSAWDAYSLDQEGLGWGTLRPVMERIRPLFDMAIAADATLLTKVPALGKLLGVRTAIGQKAAATRKRIRESKAKGDTVAHGEAGKARKRAEEKAALETLQEQHASTAAPAGQGTVTTAPVAVVTAPAATGTTPVVSATSAVPAVTNGVNGIANGAAH